MKEISKDDLKKIIENHVHYLNKDVDDWLNMRANLQGANLQGANLQDEYLQGANLRDAYLQGANLQGANLQGANLQGANLRDANLRDAYLQCAYLQGANLQGANLRDANLQGANLRDANLQGVKINEYTCFFALQCPEEGYFIGFKKVNNIIIKLLITDSAKRSSATSRKCRCSEAKVLGFYDFKKNELNVNNVYNRAYCGLNYVKGEIIQPDSWDEDRWIECGHGIHFFLTFDEAVNY